jgi:anaerobic ribonucleoside-triphosphate reductase activating protein
MNNKIYVAGIVYGSMVDGEGLRTTIFVSGCSIGCKDCHNKKFWKKETGKAFLIKELVDLIKDNTPQRKVTISGGEPLEQKESLYCLLKELDKEQFDIGLYTSFNKDDIDNEILGYLSFLKTGRFNNSLKISGEYFGSSNQRIYYFNKEKK